MFLDRVFSDISGHAPGGDPDRGSVIFPDDGFDDGFFQSNHIAASVFSHLDRPAEKLEQDGSHGVGIRVPVLVAEGEPVLLTGRKHLFSLIQTFPAEFSDIAFA